MSYYIGLMSGTSLDAVDAALVSFSDKQCELQQQLALPVPNAMRRQALALLTPGENELQRMAQLDVLFGRLFAEAVNTLLETSAVSPTQIKAIGSHGQTLRHYPDADCPSTLQIGDPNIIAELTGITTVADFRRRDMAAGGQGAPLVPAFHEAMLRSPRENRLVLNIGGIANLTLLPADPAQAVTGFDTGPGNGLMDAWMEHHRQTPMDANGDWAASGRVDEALLKRLLDDDYFRQPPPKSTGREVFNLDWLATKTDDSTLPEDVQATLAEFTALSIARAVHDYAPDYSQLLICGGGVHNAYLRSRLAAALPQHYLGSTAEKGLHPDWVEAMAFAWLAKQTLEGRAGNLPAVTGARRPVILGAIYPV